MIKICYILILALPLMGCKKAFETEQEFFKWWVAEENGMVKKKTINNFMLEVRYMPPQYLAYKEVRDKAYTKAIYDSIYNTYKDSRTFMLSVMPEAGHASNDALFYNLQSMEEYRERVLKLNFSPGEFVSLQSDKGTFYPVLSHMENAYNIDAKKSITLVFADSEEVAGLLEANNLDIVFEDQIFDTGISHFKFEKEKLDHIPAFKFLAP